MQQIKLDLSGKLTCTSRSDGGLSPPLIPSSARTAKERRRVAPARRGAEQPLAAGCAWAAPRGAPEHGGHFVAPAQT